MSRKGFDPTRVEEAKRERPVIPQILSSETPELAKGFTEIKVAETEVVKVRRESAG